uniref:ATP-binding protein n=1 Tax=Altererythrobacter segetis TaxID=1104773 RepID=UPI001408FA0C|nr:ATP-binding protein [Altererythrobacter segetis]
MNMERPATRAGLRQLAMQVLEHHCAAAQVSWDDLELGERVAAWRGDPPGDEVRLARLSERLGLTDGELLVAALCLSSDWDPHFARQVARAQEPIGSSRPLVGLACALFGSLGLTPATLAGGNGARSGLLVLGDEPMALPERSLSIGLAVAAALAGELFPPAGVTTLAAQAVEFTATQLERMATEAEWLAASVSAPNAFVLRTPSRREALASAKQIGENLGLAPVVLAPEDLARHAVWLMAADALPCVELALGPGEARRLPALGAYDGPVVCLLGLEGLIECGIPQREWTVPLPDEGERASLWHAAGLAEDAAALAARSYRQGAGRIAELAEQARNLGRVEGFGWECLSEAVRRGRSMLDGMAHKIHATILRDELVLPPDALADLDMLLGRIVNRGNLADGLGAATRTRYGAGVRALFAGDPGTGKTLAAHWLSTQTGLPLYRVDLAAMTSKWIGETEKNLSAVLDAAQHSDVILLFDEADALFGKRTDVNDAHDRHANAQTNYLLQRIEDFDGVVILATNVRDNMDAAFARRLDLILQFPMPDSAARFALWRGHLGHGHRLNENELGALAVSVELTGGHIRNVVLAAAVRARLAGRPIGLADVLEALEDEYGKLGRTAPTVAT